MDGKVSEARDLLRRRKAEIEEDRIRVERALKALEGRRPGRKPGSSSRARRGSA